MTIVRPISAHDSDLLEQSLMLMRHFGRLENHNIVFAPAQSVAHLAEEAVAQIGDLSPNVSVLPLEFEGQDTWPQSPNLHWTLTMEALRDIGNKDPIFWMELDCDPFVANWADKIESAWRSGRTAFCGKIVPTPHRNAAGAIVHEPDDVMMMGCGVYPAQTASLRNWDPLVKGFHAQTNGEAFDVFLRGWMCGIGWTHTDLIGDRWNTINYREGLLCDPGPTEFISRDHSKTDVSGACVIHGCKDGTLGQLILQGSVAIDAPTPPSARTVLAAASPRPAPQAPAPLPSPASPPFDPARHDEIMSALQSLERTVAMLNQTIQHHTRLIQQALAAGETEEQPEQGSTEDGTVTGDGAPLAALQRLVEQQTQQIGPLAKTLNMDKESVRALIEAEGSGLKIVKGGWVKKAA